MERGRSRCLHERAVSMMPGGVSSPVRAFAPHPVYFECGKGAHVWDVDGNQYTDCCLAFGPLILGHAREEVVAAVTAQTGKGSLFGVPGELEIDMAEEVRRWFPGMEMMRFVSSGSEATMHAIRVARGYTGRKMIIKVEGGFHGAHDAVLVKAGSGATTHSAPDSLGVPAETAANTLVVPYNDLVSLERVLSAHEGEVAAMIVEPVLGNIGPVLPDEGYLEGVSKLIRDHGALLVLDEVITGFRLAMGGAQERFGVRADITVLGKVLGGGLPIGAFGARREIMSVVSPLGKVYQAGTFSGNPLSLSAGLETLHILQREGAHSMLERSGVELRRALQDILRDTGSAAAVQGIGSMFQIFFGESPGDYREALRCDGARYMRVFHSMLDQGVYLPPSQWETAFLSTAHQDEDLRRIEEAFQTALREADG